MDADAKNPKDLLFYRLIRDLSQDINSDAKDSAEETINLSTRFLDSDSQNLVEKFHDLCVNDETHQHVEGDEESDNLYAEQFNAAQKGMQQVVKKDASIRSEINVVLSAMQFSELLRQNLEGMLKSFDVLIDGNGKDIDQLRSDMLVYMHTYDERQAFYKHVMRQDMPAEDEEVTQDLIDQLIG